MFETFEEKYSDLEKKYDKKDYDGVVREGGKIIESLVAHIFRKFPSTLTSLKQKQLFLAFEKKFQTEKGNRFLDFIARPTTGVSIGYYIQLCKYFSEEKHIWLKANIKSALDTANRIRNDFAHSRPGYDKPDDDNASDLLDVFEIIIEELELQNETPDSLGIPLSSYLIHSSIIHNFDHVAKKEEDWKKIISDARKIIPQLLEYLFYSRYYEIPVEDKDKIFSEEELWSKNKDENQSYAYEKIFAEIEFGNLFETKEKVDLVIQKYLNINKEKYDRRGVKPYTKLLDILVEELTNPKYKNYLKYAVTVKNKYLHNNEIDDTERIELKSSAKSLNINSKTAYRIEQEVIRVIDNELTLYKTLQSVSNEENDSKSVSQNEKILIEMIKKGTPENIVIDMAESLNFEGDIYYLLSKFGHKKESPKKKLKEKSTNKDKIETNENAKEKVKSSTETNENFEELLKNGFGGIFGAKDTQSEKGTDLQIKVPLTLEEIATGVTKKIQYKKLEKCSVCDGKGTKNFEKSKTCSECNGTGKTTKKTNSLFGDIKTEVECENCAGFGFENVEKCSPCRGEGRMEKESIASVNFPSGVSDGQMLKVAGSGNAGRRGKDAGDLLCEVEEIKHQHFIREGENLFYDLKLSESEAEKGADVTVPILNGKIKMKIPAGVKTGKMLRVTGRGLPKLNSRERGDLFVKITLV
ncbi:MAG: J domain-containing protein [Candidatus Cloacimonetes bacterium]|nr:J domain-containing protein [Candidatus Cloacimonadota bacterium]MCF7815038.1 J domain-containing protein [Candidatus Cloacimonadota bacterium]MCF7868364.1 J domain-containing protein [Candidatus Cloacimonadota bacterium]MCF7883870.1 J domain-containing protein [Candidatus Cloacimonadota bacterium]